jgi:putative SOS response-associated peptidase YedK
MPLLSCQPPDSFARGSYGIAKCGRFTQHYTGAARNVEPRYNIAPTSTIDVVLPTVDGPVQVPMRWGLIPP